MKSPYGLNGRAGQRLRSARCARDRLKQRCSAAIPTFECAGATSFIRFTDFDVKHYGIFAPVLLDALLLLAVFLPTEHTFSMPLIDYAVWRCAIPRGASAAIVKQTKITCICAVETIHSALEENIRMMKRFVERFLATCVFCAGANAASYNAVSDFSIKSNPNGVWSYIDANQLLVTPSTGFGLSGWILPLVGFGNEGIVQNITGATLTWQPFGPPTPAAVVPTDHLYFSTGINNTVLRFTAPASASYLISGDFLGIDTVPVAHNVAVLVNGKLYLLLGASPTYYPERSVQYRSNSQWRGHRRFRQLRKFQYFTRLWSCDGSSGQHHQRGTAHRWSGDQCRQFRRFPRHCAGNVC